MIKVNYGNPHLNRTSILPNEREFRHFAINSDLELISFIANKYYSANDGIEKGNSQLTILGYGAQETNRGIYNI
jgi:hypothetical protein